MRVDPETQAYTYLDQINSNPLSPDILAMPTDPQTYQDAYQLDIADEAYLKNNLVKQDDKDIQTGISLMQIIEKGLEDSAELMQGIQELVYSAANENLTGEELQEAQNEIDQLKAGIDEIMAKTQQNVMNILKDYLANGGSLQLSEASSKGILISSGYDTAGVAGKVDTAQALEKVLQILVPVANGDDLNQSPLSLKLQVGPNRGDSYFIEIYPMNSRILSLDDVDVTTRENAVKSIKVIDKAIEGVSHQRASLGNMAWILQHRIDFMNYQQDILAEAEARIRDADMAKKMSNYVKNSIQQQISGAMLAIANQRPKMVLKLLNLL